MIYKSGTFFFAHWLAIVALAVVVPGYFITKLKRKKIWLSIHILCMVVSYYLLIGGAINEAFLHIGYLRQLQMQQSPVYGMTHFLAMFFFIGLVIFYLIKYHPGLKRVPTIKRG